MELKELIATIESALGKINAKDCNDVELFQILTSIRGYLLELKEIKNGIIPINKETINTTK